jgi:hypothetical protein
VLRLLVIKAPVVTAIIVPVAMSVVAVVVVVVT